MLNTKLFVKSVIAASVMSTLGAASVVSAADEANIEKVIVTGSYIQKGSYESASPVKVLDSSDIEGVGAVNVGDLLGRIPAVVGDTTSASSNISGQDSGLNTVALRNLGSSRTLVLVDGKRYVSGMSVASGYGVDLNTIPTTMIQRIEATNRSNESKH